MRYEQLASHVLRFRFSGPKIVRTANPWTLSASFHVAAALVYLVVVFWDEFYFFDEDLLEIDIVDAPMKAPQRLRVVEQPQQVKPKPKKKKRAVFGQSRNSVKAAKGEGLDIKAGNTTAKAPDKKLLREDDDEALPIPTEEFLVSAMPRLRQEYRIPYPVAARTAGLEGLVVLDLLIDTRGRVRQAGLVSGPGGGLNAAALKAVKKFNFYPAEVGEERVAVRIRYSYRFVLER